MASAAIPGILAEHFETFSFLWKRWKAAAVSPEYTLVDLHRLEERLNSHLDGLHEGRDAAVSLARERLAGDDADQSFAAAYFLLVARTDADAVEHVVKALAHAEGAKLAAVTESFKYAAAGATLSQLRELFAAATPAVAVAAAEVLAIHDKLDPASRRLLDLLGNEDARVRAGAWRTVAILDSMPPRQAGLRNEASPQD